ncbi:homospermidine synthase [Rhizobium leguminosarum]
MTEQNYPVYAEITGPIVMIGFGSIGRGTLPLIERHFKFDKSRMVVIDPREEPSDMEILRKHGVRHIKEYVTKDNYKELLKPLLTEGEGQGFCVNLSVDTSSLDIIKLCRKLDVPYIDTVVEPWLGFYFDKGMSNADRTNYALRETMRKEKAKNPGGATAVSTCGANPGMVSWFVKQALVNLANDTGPQIRGTGPARSRRLGKADEEARRQGRPHRRARHPAHQASEAAQRLLEHLVGRRLHL